MSTTPSSAAAFRCKTRGRLLLPGVLTTYSPLYVGVVGLGLAVAAGAVLDAAPRRRPDRDAGAVR